MTAKTCPLMNQRCIEHRCRWFIQLLGKHPQKDGPVPEWGCAVEWLPILQIENAQQTRQLAASVDSARNEARKDAVSIGHALLQVADAASARAAPMTGEILELRSERASIGRRLLRLVFKNGR